MTNPADACGNWCHLADDVIAGTFAPQERPRELTCELGPHADDEPCQAEGWSWLKGRIWRTDHE